MKNISYNSMSGTKDVQACAELYCHVFIGDDFTNKDFQISLENLHKHSIYEGFKGVKAVNENEDIIGFAYGYTSKPGQFYREKLIEHLLEIKHLWLNDCFEFVELAVHPGHTREGIGTKLQNHLLEGLPHHTAVLTVSVTNQPAFHLYRKRGWETLQYNAPLISKDDLQMILGLKLS
ncbi:GNAT family N-acetyltransferase [Halobacillus salinarum]|uniref:GNAT family N-acetyltransferase n=1 Tax=Halobacillus salinarum TaxID=2932257 RepID=A0ABY4EEG4_9BACI|nr:GNAT family N-acetyltransferase [Halobacillus salinarum]UOQ42861.1 GNAT family N-acetyltransferase [Halobacillus salinarum]